MSLNLSISDESRKRFLGKDSKDVLMKSVLIPAIYGSPGIRALSTDLMHISTADDTIHVEENISRFSVASDDRC
jgi:hypothetical protein